MEIYSPGNNPVTGGLELLTVTDSDAAACRKIGPRTLGTNAMDSSKPGSYSNSESRAWHPRRAAPKKILKLETAFTRPAARSSPGIAMEMEKATVLDEFGCPSFSSAKYCRHSKLTKFLAGVITQIYTVASVHG
jgi:hypothetical protein